MNASDADTARRGIVGVPNVRLRRARQQDMTRGMRTSHGKELVLAGSGRAGVTDARGGRVS